MGQATTVEYREPQMQIDSAWVQRWCPVRHEESAEQSVAHEGEVTAVKAGSCSQLGSNAIPH